MLHLNKDTNRSEEDISNAENEDRVFLEESFYISTNKKNVLNLKIIQKGIILTKQYKHGKQKSHLIPVRSIIGVRCGSLKPSTKTICLCGGNLRQVSEEQNKDCHDLTSNDAYLYIYTYVIKNRRNNKSSKERNTIALRFRSFDKYEENEEEANKWKHFLITLLYEDRVSLYKGQVFVKGYLIFLNPKSGKGNARDVFHKTVAPTLSEADMPFDLFITKSANFARQFVRTKCIFQWSAIVVLGGDGLFFEVINGVFERHDWREVIQNIRFGIIPAGSGNGLAKTISYLSGDDNDLTPTLSASISLVNGTVSPMDLVKIETKDKIVYSSLAFGWGFIADIDILSEKIRAIGYPRFTLWSLKNIVTLPKYKGKVSYLPFKSLENYDSACSQRSRNLTDIPNQLNLSSEEIALDIEADTNETLTSQSTNNTKDYRGRLESWYSINSKKTTYYSTTDSSYQSVNDETYHNNVCMYGPPSKLPSLVSSVPDDWVVIEDDFVMIHATWQTHLSLDCHFSPNSKLNDGIIWMLVMRGAVSRAELTSFLIGMSSGTHLPKSLNKNIHMIPCQAFRLEPSDDDGIITIDGENVKYGPVQGEIIPGIINVIVPQHKNN